MIRTPQARIFVALGVLALTIGEARAQISVLERPDPGGVSVVQTLPYGTFTRSEACAAPGFKATLTLDPTNFPGEYGGALEAGDASISGAISKRETWQFNSSVDARSSYNMNIFADVVPGSKVRLRFQGSYQISWSTGNVLENHAGFLFTPESGTAINGGVVKGGTGLPSASEQFSVDLQASPTYSTIEGGRTYYKLGNFSITGRGVLGSTNSGESVSYRAGISNLQAYYIGPALMLNDGSGQTGLVAKGLSKPLSVKVFDGETGAAVSGVPITFTIAELSNGAKFANGLTTIVSDTVEGIASASLILGSTAGPYTVKATCPADVCTSGAKEVAFTETAIADHTDVTGTAPEGCSQVAIGNITVPVDPVTRTFRLYNVPLTMNSPLFLSPPELDITCNNDAECPVEDAQRMPEGCAQGNFNAPRFGGKTHDGIDLPMGNGVSIRSATQGNVVFVGQFVAKRPANQSWGTVVIIQSTRRVGDKYEMLMYGHLDPTKLRVKTGDPVVVGQEIALASLSGATGNIREVLDGDEDTPAMAGCLHVHVERRLLNKPIAIIGFPVPCAIKSKEFMDRCNNSDMYANGNAEIFWQAEPTDPDTEIGCGVYR